MKLADTRPKRIVIAGAGRTARALCAALSEAWEIIVLDLAQERIARLRSELPPGKSLRALQKDATSLLNLRAAGIEGATWVVALTDRDDTNIEICRLALSVEKPPAAIGVAHETEAADRMKALGAEAILRPAAVAGLVGNVINKGARVAVSVGLGQGEVVEIPVLPSSPAVDARVADLHARGWLVAAIYREDKIIIPHGDVYIRRGDRLLLSGQPEILPHIADYLRAGVGRFPLQYGRRFVALDDGHASAGFWAEVADLARRSEVREVCVLGRGGAVPPPAEGVTWVPTPLDPALPLPEQLERDAGRLQAGLLVLPKTPQGLARRIGLLRPSFAGLLDALPCPVLLATGVNPYRRILLPVTDSRGTVLSADLAIDLARRLALPIATVTVTPPAFVVGQEAIEEQTRALETVGDVAALYDLPMERIHREGNPVTEIRGLSGDGDLLVIGSRAGRRPALFRPDPSVLLMVHAPCSVLVLSYREGRAGGRA